MNSKKSEVCKSPMVAIIATIALLMAVAALVTETVGLESQPLEVDQLDVPADHFLVRRSTAGDDLDRPSLRPIRTEGRELQLDDAYRLYRIDFDSADWGRLDGILMDDPWLFAQICCTV